MSATTTTAWIALGSNLGDRRAHLEQALSELARLGRVEASSILETDPVGGPSDQPRFLNAVARVETRLDMRALFTALQSIERAHGRDRSAEVANGPRPLDLDLLLFGDARSDASDLRVPHPRFEDRLFVLLPLCELAPEMRLPRARVSVAERVRELGRMRETPHAREHEVETRGTLETSPRASGSAPRTPDERTARSRPPNETPPANGSRNGERGRREGSSRG